MSVIKGDFLGFTFDGIHSSELGIFRVSDGNRYTENLLPTIQDKTTQVPGADGTYFHDSFFTQKQFNLSVAFDDLSETQLHRLKQVFGDKKIHNLILDEVPYKVYKVKITGTPNLKYICFNKNKDEFGRESSHFSGNLYGVSVGNTSRVYKGEGQLNFIAYTPYAKSRYKYRDQYNADNIPEWSYKNYTSEDIYDNRYEWLDSIKFLNSNTTGKYMEEGHDYTIDKFESGHGKIMVYNPGDMPTDFILKVYPAKSRESIHFSLLDKSKSSNVFIMEKFDLLEGDSGFQINTKLNLVEGIDGKGEITGTLYNKYISSGDFFKIQVTEKPYFLVFYDYTLSTESKLDVNSHYELQYDYLFY
jgi:hypothetical protein